MLNAHHNTSLPYMGRSISARTYLTDCSIWTSKLIGTDVRNYRRLQMLDVSCVYTVHLLLQIEVK